MTDPSAQIARRAATLLRWYPKQWRARYGDEFAELLMSELSEHPRSWRRSADVARSGLTARLSSAGLGGHTLDPNDQVRASLVSVVSAVAVFLAFGVAMWAQLTIGWQWSQPNTSATKVAMMVMSGAMALFVCLALLAALPVVGSVLARVARRQWHGLVGPTSLLLVGAGLLISGVGISATGGRGPEATRGPSRASCPVGWRRSHGRPRSRSPRTGPIPSHWRRSRRPRSSGWRSARWPWSASSWERPRSSGRVELGPRALRYEARLAGAAAVVMLVFLGACCGWIVDGGPGTAEPLPCRSHRRGRGGHDGRRSGRRGSSGVLRSSQQTGLPHTLTS